MAAVSVKRSICAHTPTPPRPPPPQKKKKLHNHCFQFLLGITVGPREIEGNGHTKFWGANRVHYGICENGELREENTPISI